MRKLKIVFLGAGSAYFRGVFGEIAITKELDGGRIALYDPDVKRMGANEAFGRKVMKKARMNVKVAKCSRLEEAVDGADFVIASVGVHGPSYAWHKLDSNVCAELGIIHTTGDTVGPAGVSQGLRIVPIFVDAARKMQRYCPDAKLLNHSNPMSVICRAVRKYTGINVIGYCHCIHGAIAYLARILDLPMEELDVDIAGPNHMSWLLGLRHRGQDLYPRLGDLYEKHKNDETLRFAWEIYRTLGAFPIGADRHMIEFFPQARGAAKPSELDYGMMWRTDMIERQFLSRELAHPEAKRRARVREEVRLPKSQSPEAMGNQIRAMALGNARGLAAKAPDPAESDWHKETMGGREMIHFVNAPNSGAVPNLPDWAILDLKCTIGAYGARPVHVGDLPTACARWSLAQIYAHELVVDAAVEGSREKAIAALACDPMILDLREARRVLDALVEAHGERLAAFRGR